MNTSWGIANELGRTWFQRAIIFPLTVVWSTITDYSGFTRLSPFFPRSNRNLIDCVWNPFSVVHIYCNEKRTDRQTDGRMNEQSGNRNTFPDNDGVEHRAIWMNRICFGSIPHTQIVSQPLANCQQPWPHSQAGRLVPAGDKWGKTVQERRKKGGKYYISYTQENHSY